MADPLTIGVLGAGSIGAYVGLRLAAGGSRVLLVGRRSLVDAHEAGALAARTLEGEPVPPPANLQVHDSAAALSEVDLCLVCVKSRDTFAAARELAGTLRSETLVVSLQNGLRNAERLRAAGLARVVPGMVSFNVFREPEQPGQLRQTTSGPVILGEPDTAKGRSVLSDLIALARRADLDLRVRADIDAVLAGKLLLNLNNAICTLAGASIASSLRSRPLRRCFAASMREGLQILDGAGREVATIGKLPPRLIARLLPLPDAIVLRAARSMITVDPAARSSTLVDLEQGKPTEIDALNGELVSLAREHDLPCPINRWIVDEIHRLEATRPLPFWSPDRLWHTITKLG